MNLAGFGKNNIVKLRKIVGVMLGLLVFSMSVIGGVSAAPVSPASAGCQATHVSGMTRGATYTFGADTPAYFFYDADIVHISASALGVLGGVQVNVHVTSNWGFDETYSNIHSLNLTLPTSGEYIFAITSVSGKAFEINMSCTSTAMSSGCLVTNGDFLVGTTFSGGYYNAGEILTVTNHSYYAVNISGAASTTLYISISQPTVHYTFPVTGTYSITFQQEFRGTPVDSVISCALPS